MRVGRKEENGMRTGREEESWMRIGREEERMRGGEGRQGSTR